MIIEKKVDASQYKMLVNHINYLFGKGWHLYEEGQNNEVVINPARWDDLSRENKEEATADGDRAQEDVQSDTIEIDNFSEFLAKWISRIANWPNFDYKIIMF